MAYTILNTDGSTLLLLADGEVDQSTTSLALVGRNTSNYGEYINNNFVKLLTNSASTAGTPPRSPLKGELWYDTTSKRLKVYDDGFKPLSGVAVSGGLPTNSQTGDLWYDSVNHQLNIVSGVTTYLVGPAYPSTTGAIEQSWIIPPTNKLVYDTDSNVKQLLALKTYGDVVALAYSGNSFVMNETCLDTYLTTYTTGTAKVVKGITIAGDLAVYGQVTNNYLTITIDIDKLNGVSLGVNDDAGDDSPGGDIDYQNTEISYILDKVFPSSPNLTGNYQQYGLPLGSVARVICLYRKYNGVTVDDMHVRLFKTAGSEEVSHWTADDRDGLFTKKNIID